MFSFAPVRNGPMGLPTLQTGNGKTVRKCLSCDILSVFH